jgi:predicted small lipoprotein YifL
VKVMIVVVVAAAVAACGVMGTPIPPEDVGVAPVILQQKRADAEAAKREGEQTPTLLEPQGQDVDLPPLRPVGTR